MGISFCFGSYKWPNISRINSGKSERQQSMRCVLWRDLLECHICLPFERLPTPMLSLSLSLSSLPLSLSLSLLLSLQRLWVRCSRPSHKETQVPRLSLRHAGQSRCQGAAREPPETDQNSAHYHAHWSSGRR